MILRPYGIVIAGRLEVGLELLLNEGAVTEIRPHTGIPENFVVSPAFVNAHSHLEYRGMQGKLQSTEYWPWIREITEMKRAETDIRVRRDTIAAAHENHKTGVGIVAEHSDRPYAATALVSAGLNGVVFQETITFFEQKSRLEKLASIRQKAAEQAGILRKTVFLTPHAYHTVDRETLADFGRSREPISIHVAETPLESQFTRDGSGPIGDFYRQVGFDVNPTGKDIVPTLADLGLVRYGAQFVHCCDISPADIQLLAANKVSVAHCPRSNTRLKCPIAPIREMLDAGIPVGLGLDSPASSGPIDMFDEMREALKVSLHRGKPLDPEEVWRMATSAGANSLQFVLGPQPTWDIFVGSKVPLIRIAVPNAATTAELIERATPAQVSWA